MCPLMGVKCNPGTADVACPDSKIAGSLNPELANCSFVFQSLDFASRDFSDFSTAS